MHPLFIVFVLLPSLNLSFLTTMCGTAIAVDPTRGESLTGDESSDFTFHDYFSRKLRPEYNYNWNHPVRIAIASSRDIQPHKLQLFLVSVGVTFSSPLRVLVKCASERHSRGFFSFYE